MTDNVTKDKVLAPFSGDSAATAPAANLAGEISLMRKIKRHLENCQCCREALNSENNIEAGYQPAPDETATTHTQQAKLGNVSYNR
jgi:hypothetical protein